jgi:hypothetical protein
VTTNHQTLPAASSRYTRPPDIAKPSNSTRTEDQGLSLIPGSASAAVVIFKSNESYTALRRRARRRHVWVICLFTARRASARDVLIVFLLHSLRKTEKMISYRATLARTRSPAQQELQQQSNSQAAPSQPKKSKPRCRSTTSTGESLLVAEVIMSGYRSAG